LRDALQDIVPEVAQQDENTLSDLDINIADFDPLYAASRGAAEFAKRAQEGRMGCREREECKERRKALKASMASHPGVTTQYAHEL